ncbi:MAG: uroporphyrinogen-III synthase, partial [Gammaproteobacteria bacterium]
MKRLEGARIVVTLPAGMQDRLALRLAAEGARVLSFPALDLVSVESAEPPAGEFDCAFFVSPAAVRYGLPYLSKRLPLCLLAPGEGTRAALIAAGAGDALAP